jgi:hypothetical protein
MLPLCTHPAEGRFDNLDSNWGEAFRRGTGFLIAEVDTLHRVRAAQAEPCVPEGSKRRQRRPGSHNGRQRLPNGQ